jgi:nitrogen fixation/metabolism regulation signal transduction histidine kinase
MASNTASTNVSFDFLKESSEFLNIILDNISVCVLLLDKDLKLQAFNNSVKTIFSARKDDELLYRKCGEAIGCAYQVEEETDCGSTSRCCSCELKVSVLKSYLEGQAIYKTGIVKPFYTYAGVKEDKHLQFSTRLFIFKKERYVILMVEDINHLIMAKN